MISDGQTVEILIGHDCPEILRPFELRVNEQPGAVSAPFTTRTLFEWTINGPLGGDQTGGGSSCFRKFVTLEQQVEQFWKIEGTQLNKSQRPFS